MSKEEWNEILSSELKKFRSWSYSALAEKIEQTQRERNHLHHIEATAVHGTPYFIDFDVFWDGKSHGDIRVCAFLWSSPQRPLLGFLPIYKCDFSDSFILSPGGRFVGEDNPNLPP